MLSRHDENERIDAHVAGLVRLLERSERLDDALVEDAASEGELAILSAILARRGGVPETRVWAHLVTGADGRLMQVARLAGLGRTTAARLIGDLGALTGIDDPTAELAAFDRLGAEAIEDERGEWRLPVTYHTARACMGGQHG